jgi:hypothetical protein
MSMRIGRRVVGRASLLCSIPTTRRDSFHLRRVVFSTTTPTSSTAALNTSANTNTSTKKNEVDHRRATMIAQRNMEITNLGQAGRWEEIVAMFRHQHQQQGGYDVSNLATMLAQLTQIPAFQKETQESYRSAILHDIAQSIAASSLSQPQQQPKARSFFGRLHTTNSELERNVKITTYGKAQQWKNILDLFQQEQNNYALPNFSNTLSQLAKIPEFPHDDPILFDILRATADRIEATVIDTRHFANICHSIGKLRMKRDPAAYRIVNHLSNRTFVQDFVDRANPQCIANVAWSLAKLRRPYHMRILLSVMDNNNNNDQCRNAIMADDKPQHLSNIIWACAKLGQTPSPAWFAAMEQRADWLVANGNQQDIANTAWAFATLGKKSNAWFGAIEKRSDWLVTDGSLQSIANTAWAFATLDHPSPALFSAIEKRSDWLVAHGNPQEISCTAWAFAKLNYPAPALFTAIKNRSDWFVSRGRPEDISMLASAFARLNHKAPALFAAIDNRADLFVTKGSPYFISNTAAAFAKLGHKAPVLFAAIEKRSDWFVAKGTVHDIAITASAFVELGHDATTFLSTIAKQWDRLKSKGDQRSVQSLADTLAHSGRDQNDPTTTHNSTEEVIEIKA